MVFFAEFLGDTVVVMATNSSVTNQGCFWLCESHSESVQFDLYHISQSLGLV